MRRVVPDCKIIVNSSSLSDIGYCKHKRYRLHIQYRNAGENKMTNLNANDLMKMKATEVADLADVDFYAVRDEGFRRQTAAEAKLARLLKQVAKAQAEMAEAGSIITAALRQQQAEADALTVDFNARRAA
jgi:hypothetical protein